MTATTGHLTSDDDMAVIRILTDEESEIDGSFEAPMLMNGRVTLYFREINGNLWHKGQGMPWNRVMGPTEADWSQEMGK